MGEETAQKIKNAILDNLNYFENMSSEQIYDHRKNKFLSIGRGDGIKISEGSSGLTYNETKYKVIIKNIYINNFSKCLR